MVIINADDWGRTTQETDAIANCFQENLISSASAMVFMEDSVRAAKIANEIGIDIGLHLNFTESYTSDIAPQALRNAQDRIAQFLSTSPYSPILYNPLLQRDFRLAVSSQLQEFRRLYGKEPANIDGHHHQHLCSNVLFGGFLPRGKIVRRHFTFFPGEKSWANRNYRALCDRYLARRHKLVGGFFALTQHKTRSELEGLTRLASSSVIELMVHPGDRTERHCLTTPAFLEWIDENDVIDFGDFADMN